MSADNTPIKKKNTTTLMLVAMLAAAVVATTLAITQNARESTTAQQTPATEALTGALQERWLGDEQAPLVIYEYSSLGCPHCRTFHRDVLPAIQKRYIETGKLRLVFRDYPLGDRAFAAALVARCVAKEKFFPVVDLFFNQQEQWSSAEDGLAAIIRTAQFAGITEDTVRACLDNQPLADAMLQRAQEAQEVYKIRGTPSFVVQQDGVMTLLEAPLTADAVADLLGE